VLMIFGAADRRWEPSAAHQYDPMPNARVVMLPGVGTYPCSMRPRRPASCCWTSWQQTLTPARDRRGKSRELSAPRAIGGWPFADSTRFQVVAVPWVCRTCPPVNGTSRRRCVQPGVDRVSPPLHRTVEAERGGEPVNCGRQVLGFGLIPSGMVPTGEHRCFVRGFEGVGTFILCAAGLRPSSTTPAGRLLNWPRRPVRVGLHFGTRQQPHAVGNLTTC